MKIAYENILEISEDFAIIEADEDTKQGNELEDNEKMIVLIEGKNADSDDYIMSVTQWNDGTVTVFDNINFIQWTVEDWETGFNELCERMDSYDEADNAISNFEDYDC